MRIIDAHVILGEGAHTSLTPEDLLPMMDAAGVSVSIGHAADRFLAIGNVEGNDRLLAAVQRHPDRIAGLASVNPWFGERATDELNRSLSAGLSGLYLNSFYQGFALNDPILDPLLEIAGSFDVPVFAMTGIPLIAEPFQLVEMALRFPTIHFVMVHAGASDYYHDAIKAPVVADNVWLETSRNGPSNYGLFESKGVLGKCVFGSATPEYDPATEIDVVRRCLADEDLLTNLLGTEIQTVFKGRLPS